MPFSEAETGTWRVINGKLIGKGSFGCRQNRAESSKCADLGGFKSIDVLLQFCRNKARICYQHFVLLAAVPLLVPCVSGRDIQIDFNLDDLTSAYVIVSFKSGSIGCMILAYVSFDAEVDNCTLQNVNYYHSLLRFGCGPCVYKRY